MKERGGVQRLGDSMTIFGQTPRRQNRDCSVEGREPENVTKQLGQGYYITVFEWSDHSEACCASEARRKQLFLPSGE